MQFEEGLAFPLASLANGFPLTPTQLDSIIALFPAHEGTTQTHALLRILHIAERALSPDSRLSVPDSLGLILQALGEKLRLDQPLRCLVGCQFEQFWQYCTSLQDHELRSALQWSFGLYPVAVEQAGQSIFLQRRGPSSGNAQWLFSRHALKEYYRIRGAKLGEAVREIFAFLLSDRELLDKWKNDPLKLLWAEIYLMYNHLILQPHLKEMQISGGDDVVTWLRPTIEETMGRLRQLETGLPLQERQLLYLILAILAGDEQWRKITGEGLFQKAFSAFLQGYSETAEWQDLMALLLFSRTAKATNLPTIAEQCGRQFKLLLAEPHFLDKLVPFLYFFLSEEEVLQVIYTNALEYWRLPLPDGLKRKAAVFLVERGVLHLRSLKYVSREQLLDSIFRSSSVLEEAAVGVQLMDALQSWQSEVLGHLKYFALSVEEGIRNYRLFIELWRNYYRLLEISNLERAEEVLNGNGDFHPTLAFRLPTNSPNALLNILIRIARAYQAKCDSLHDLPVLSQRIHDFREKSLPPLLAKLNAEQQAEFEKEWGQMRKEAIE